MILTQAELEALAKLLVTKTEEMIIPILHKRDGGYERPNDLRETIKQLKGSLVVEQGKTQEIQQKLSE